MSRRHQRNTHVEINHVEIPASIRRDVILEHDSVYAENAMALTRRASSGKIDSQQFSAIQQWLQAAALRRAHVTRSESPRLLNA